MAFRAVQVHSLDGIFLGFAVQQEGAQKLHSANLWEESETADIREQLDRLNDQRAVLNYWPDVRDPDVQALLSDPEWEKLALSPQEVVDDTKSIFVWIEEPTEENPYGKMDEDASTIVTKNIMVPAPTDVQQRVKKACELVARKRSEEAYAEG